MNATRPALALIRRLARWAYAAGRKTADRTSRRNRGGTLTTGERRSPA